MMADRFFQKKESSIGLGRGGKGALMAAGEDGHEVLLRQITARGGGGGGGGGRRPRDVPSPNIAVRVVEQRRRGRGDGRIIKRVIIIHVLGKGGRRRRRRRGRRRGGGRRDLLRSVSRFNLALLLVDPNDEIIRTFSGRSRRQIELLFLKRLKIILKSELSCLLNESAESQA